MSATLPDMERNMLKVLGNALRRRNALQDNKNSKELRRLIVEVERRQRELDSKRDEPPKGERH
jgi:hypothetical protein